ncbi:MAG TPA: type II toxin-antitoxin system VapC family toxin [Candidatus Gastranaerophilales bacterium]|nr:type II toxin-antitoxin system VapC family toxin [Candidatus Gastranaerophilales bacterium]
MGQRYLIDTNIIIYNFQDEFPPECVEVIDKIFDESFNISIISEIEFLGWKNFSKEDLKDAGIFLDFACIYPLNSEIKDLTIKIKQKNNIKLGDAIIAATAIYHDYTLVTRNSKDFEKVENLKLFNPFES